MFDIDKNLKYFEDNKKGFMTYQKPKGNGKVQQMSYPLYDKGLEDFIHDIYESDLLLKEYMEIVENNVKGHPLEAETVTNLGYVEACAVLTWIIRSDRFSDGALGRAAESGQIYNVLKQIEYRSETGNSNY